MKMYLSKMVALAIVLVFCGSCQKEVEIADSENDTQHISEGSILDRYVNFDTTRDRGLDTITVYQFFYDSQKRVIRISEKWYEQGTMTVASTGDDIRFYHSNDTLPYKVVKNSIANGISYTDTLFLNYDSKGIIARDSLVNYRSGSKLGMYCFYYNETIPWGYTIAGSAYDYVLATPIETNKISLTRNFVNGNVMASYDSVYTQTIPAYYGIIRYTYTYDGKPNPFAKMALHYPDYNYDVESSSYDYYTKNNPVSYERTTYSKNSPVPYTTQVELQYTYNSLGYPITIKVSRNGNQTDFLHKVLLFYKG